MKKIFVVILLIFSLTLGTFLFKAMSTSANYGAPPYIEDEISTEQDFGKFGDLSKWVRPDGPLRVGLQAGHWKNEELPDELKRLRKTGGGTSNGLVAEWEVNLAIAKKTKIILEKEGTIVDILPATIPPAYFAEAYPMAPAVNLETGFLTNPTEAKMLINNPELPTSAIAQALITFLREKVKL